MQSGATTLRQKLQNGKRYLKTEYRMQCEEDGSPCPDHCTYFALSDLQNTEFQGTCAHEHEVRCANCESLKSVIQEISNESESPLKFSSEDQKEDLQHDHN